MSILKSKHSGWTWEGRRTPFGGGGGGPTTSTTNTSNLPEYVQPYVENMLESAQKQIYNDDMTTFRPYQAYSSDPNAYVAGFSPLQQRAQQTAYNMQMPSQFGQATNLSAAAGQGGLNAQGQANQLMNTALGYGQAGSNYGAAGSQYGAVGADQARADSMRAQQAAQMYGQQGSMYGAQAAGLAPEAQRYGRTAADIGQMGLRAEQLGRDVSQQARDYAAQQAGAGTQFQRQVTDPSQIAQYMSPYQQQVTDIAKADALRNAQLAQQQANLGSARQGTYGGARQALAQAEREKNLLSNLSNIQATGSQSAYDKAMQQMQYGSGLGLQGLSGAQSGLGTALQGAQTGLSGIGTAMQGQQTGLSGLGQAGSLYGQGMQGAGVGLSGVGQMLGAGQLGLSGAQTGIQGSQAGMQGAGVGLSGVGQGINAGQYGMQGLNLANTAAGTMGNLGSQQLAGQQGIANLQSQMGGQQQSQEQQKINQAIQDYATAQQYPMMQLGMLNALLRGLPLQQTTTQQYQAQPGIAQQALGLGLGGAAAYKAFS